MNICSILFIPMILVTIAIIAVPIIMIRVWNKHQKKLEELSQYNINVNAIIDQTIPEILETFVKIEFDKYCAKELVTMENEYISEDQESKIIDDMIDICSARLSPAMADKLSLFWRHESIGSVIADQIYLTVVAYRSHHNMVKADKK